MAYANHDSRPAYLGGQPSINPADLPSWPIHGIEEVDAVTRVIKSGIWNKYNPIIEEFEQEFALFQGCPLALSATNGTHTLEMILRALGIGPGDEVVVPNYTFISTATAVLAVGATPVLVDIETNTLTLSPQALEAALTPSTQAIIFVHFAGVAGTLREVLPLADRRGIPVIEDCAHAHGCTMNQQGLGSFGIAGSFSFQASKTLSAGEGGAIVTGSNDLRNQLWSLRNCGRLPQRSSYEHFTSGSNFRITAYQAALLRVQLKRLQQQIPLRLENIQRLDESLASLPGITPQFRHPNDSAPGYLYLFYYDSEGFSGLSLAQFVQALQAEGVPCRSAGYPPVHRTALFQKLGWGDAVFPNSGRATQDTVWLPHQLLLSAPEQVDKVIAAMAKIQQHSSSIALAM